MPNNKQTRRKGKHMTFMARHQLVLVAAVAALMGHSLAAVPRPRKIVTLADHPERGDVPGWVMITLMSAVLVAALLALAGPALEAMFNQAMDTVGK
jgi:ABC-type transport system involved in cytochrome c biogenesis permease subunit